MVEDLEFYTIALLALLIGILLIIGIGWLFGSATFLIISLFKTVSWGWKEIFIIGLAIYLFLVLISRR